MNQDERRLEIGSLLEFLHRIDQAETRAEQNALINLYGTAQNMGLENHLEDKHEELVYAVYDMNELLAAIDLQSVPIDPETEEMLTAYHLGMLKTTQDD